MSHMPRREFLVKSLGASAALSLSSGVGAKIMGANDRVRLGIVGINSKGAQHIELFREIPGVQVAALCDVDQNVLGRELQKLSAVNEKPSTFTDIRALLDSKDIDAIVVATPNHWHTLMGIWACQAGKDVYVEKPVSHNIWEGRKLVEAAQKYKRVVQAGTQFRSEPAIQEVLDYIHSGELGDMKLVRGLCYKPRNSIGRVAGIQPIPAPIDYNLWTGPAPLKPLRRQQLHYDWHWQWDTGNGDIGNQGVHEMDMCRWATGHNKLPEHVISLGGRFGYEDDGETPNTLITYYDYKPTPIIFEVRGLPTKKNSTAMDNYRGVRIGIIIECEKGYFAGGGGGGWIYDNNHQKVKQFAGGGGGEHGANFINVVRSRKMADLHAPVLGGHLSSALCHLGNISYLLGQKTAEPAILEQLNSNNALLQTFRQFQDHLSANWVDLSKDLLTLGAGLDIDANNETFVSRQEYDLGWWANSFLKSEYRKPFIVPDKV